MMEVMRRYVVTAALVALAGVIALSLVSFNVGDSSWFCITTEQMPVQNTVGVWGAYAAALLVVLFGSAAWLVASNLCISAFLVCRSDSLRNEWDRYAALVLIVIVCAALMHAYCIELVPGVIPGGIIGMYAHNSVNALFEAPLHRWFLHILLLILLIVITRCIGTRSARLMIKGALYATHGDLRAWPLVRWIHAAYKACKHIIMYCYTFVRGFFPGTIINQHGSSVVTLERDDYVVPQPEDTFWQHYVHEQVMSRSSETQNHNEFLNHQSLSRTSSHTAQQIHQNVPYELPATGLLSRAKSTDNIHAVTAYHKEQAHTLEEKLERFGVFGSVVAIKPGPVITMFEYQPRIDVKISKILALEDDLTLALQAVSMRIIAPIPGKAVVGFEVSNVTRHDVKLGDIIVSDQFKQFSGMLPLVLGQDSVGMSVVVDLATMPHLLVAGSTGSGKSIGLNCMLTSLLYHCSPDDVSLILIDPKRIEFTAYQDLPHLLFPIVTDPRVAVSALRWVVQTMEERYVRMAQLGVKNCAEYMRDAVQNNVERMPHIVVIIDELSDLMITGGREIEDMLVRIAQMARAAGIHLIVATQRPSVDVITGLIKVNFPSRIAFKVISKIDSRTIIDAQGAEKLLGKGDMLFLDAGSRLRRVHGAYISTQEIEHIVAHCKTQRTVVYHDLTVVTTGQAAAIDAADQQLYQEVLQFLQTIDEISISLLQRRFRIGYNRSARIIEMLQEEGRILPTESGAKTRKVIR